VHSSWLFPNGDLGNDALAWLTAAKSPVRVDVDAQMALRQP
jgi:hypothetical protein